jgi:hypothetical protein
VLDGSGLGVGRAAGEVDVRALGVGATRGPEADELDEVGRGDAEVGVGDGECDCVGVAVTVMLPCATAGPFVAVTANDPAGPAW